MEISELEQDWSQRRGTNVIRTLQDICTSGRFASHESRCLSLYRALSHPSQLEIKGSVDVDHNQDWSQRWGANIRETLQDICNDDDVIKCLPVNYWCLEGDDKILIPCHALTGVDVTKVKFRNVFMTVTPRHAPRDTCDEGLPMPTFLCFTENTWRSLVWFD